MIFAGNKFEFPGGFRYCGRDVITIGQRERDKCTKDQAFIRMIGDDRGNDAVC
jgi:hypothetical protein